MFSPYLLIYSSLVQFEQRFFLPQRGVVVILFVVGVCSVAEIAVEMNISVSTVKTYKARAIESLRNYLKDEPILLYWIIFKID